MKIAKTYIAIMDKINTVLKAVITLALSLLIIAVFGQVVAREFHISVPALDELARYTNIYMGFLAAAVCMRSESMIKIDTLHMTLHGKAKEIVISISRVFSLVFILVSIYSGILLTKLGVGQTSTSLDMHMSGAYVIIPISFILALLNWIAYTIEKKTKKEEEK